MVITISSLLDAEFLEDGCGLLFRDAGGVVEEDEVIHGYLISELLFLLTRRRLFWKYSKIKVVGW
jgi:hypothetical protein